MKFRLTYEGKEYIVEDPYDYGNDKEVPFMWSGGNFSCDCNKSLFIKDQCDPSFPEFPCGDRIKLSRKVVT